MPRDSRARSPRGGRGRSPPQRKRSPSRKGNGRSRSRSRDARSRSQSRERRGARGSARSSPVRGTGAGGRHIDAKELTSKIEGPNDKHCYRAFSEVKKANGAKVTAAGPWQGDKRSAERDRDALVRAFDDGGAEGLFKQKSELFRKRHGR